MTTPDMPAGVCRFVDGDGSSGPGNSRKDKLGAKTYEFGTENSYSFVQRRSALANPELEPRTHPDTDEI
jgi:hypothetical protein